MTERPFRQIEDHLFDHLARLAEAHEVAFQVRTGFHAGNGNFIENSKPTHLTNLFILYPRLRVDLFRLSYPYQGEAAAIAEVFPNVHIDLCYKTRQESSRLKTSRKTHILCDHYSEFQFAGVESEINYDAFSRTLTLSNSLPPMRVVSEI